MISLIPILSNSLDESSFIANFHQSLTLASEPIGQPAQPQTAGPLSPISTASADNKIPSTILACMKYRFSRRVQHPQSPAPS